MEAAATATALSPPLMATPAAECILCASPIPLSHRTPPARAPLLPCGHTHCLSCLRRNFHIALVGVPFQPARCCDPSARIEPSLLRDCLGLTSHEVHAYRERLAEYDTRHKVYCFDPRCSAFIPEMLRAGRTGRCRVCWKKTCLQCGGRGHFGGCGAADADGNGSGEEAGVVGGTGVREGRGGNGDAKVAPAKGKKKPKVSNDERFWRLSKEMGW
ncbi:Alcohol-sensitive RING finger protein 1 [Madurella mycetomatis]|uniref:Alcohol-sensitive RING finger protein 1 n=1 Tax=Madurella mycetomatis TaxID=100816 RepID=A0A175VZH3_9PEZI|nr:Alcohol-sensitive RING finger protein 1 [Madurella mycetomatis]